MTNPEIFKRLDGHAKSMDKKLQYAQFLTAKSMMASANIMNHFIDAGCNNVPVDTKYVFEAMSDLFTIQCSSNLELSNIRKSNVEPMLPKDLKALCDFKQKRVEQLTVENRQSYNDFLINDLSEKIDSLKKSAKVMDNLSKNFLPRRPQPQPSGRAYFQRFQRQKIPFSYRNREVMNTKNQNNYQKKDFQRKNVNKKH